ncbi:MAG: dTMP kinase [Chloroflexi bacterium]|nr:dTMP kinase [Chloroflexota bacterium]
MGLLITFEGGEASGKSTQARRLRARLVRQGYTVVLAREPGSTPLGERLRRLLKQTSTPIIPEAELLLFEACRAQLVAQVIRPALDRGNVVVCDRFADSSLAYQGYGRGLDLELVRGLNRVATGGLAPDLTILLDMPWRAARRRRRAAVGDRFEGDAAATCSEESGAAVAEFHRRVREGYLALAQQGPKRWVVINGAQPPDQVAQEVWRAVQPKLPPV